MLITKKQMMDKVVQLIHQEDYEGADFLLHEALILYQEMSVVEIEFADGEVEDFFAAA